MFCEDWPIRTNAPGMLQSCSIPITNPTRACPNVLRAMLNPALLHASCVHAPGAIDSQPARCEDPPNKGRSAPLRVANQPASDSATKPNEMLVFAARLRMRTVRSRWFRNGASFALLTAPIAAGLEFNKLELDQNPESYRKTVPPGDTFIASAKPSKHRA